MKKTLVTAAGPSMLGLLHDYSLPLFEQFAIRNGYDVVVRHITEDSMARKDQKAKHARWMKLSFIRDALRSSDLVVWFDADVMLTRTDEDIATHLDEKAFQGLVLHDVPYENRINPNTGVWVLKHCPMAFEFLDMIDRIGMPDGRWSDQGAVMRAMGWKLGDEQYHGAKMPTQSNQFIDATTWLPIGWNQPYMTNRPNPEAYIGRPSVSKPHAVHFMAMTSADRAIYMQQLARETAHREVASVV